MAGMPPPPLPAAGQPSPARAFVVSVVRRAGQVIGLTPPRIPNAVGESPFQQSVAASSMASAPADVEEAAAAPVDEVVDAANEEREITQSMLRDFVATGDGGDSDEEGEEANIHNFPRDNNNNDPDADELDADDSGEQMTEESNPDLGIPGAPPGWCPPQPPEGHVYAPKHDAPALFSSVDNPGGFDSYSFQPKYDKSKKYTGHATPAGAKVVPANADGKRIMEGWEFFYQGWEASDSAKETYVRGEAKHGNLMPASRKGCLDVEEMKKLGMTAKRVSDPLFIYQMLFPLCEPSKSGINDDKRMPYYSQTALYTNTYAALSGGGVGYGHLWKNASAVEMIKWEGIPIRHGSLDGNPGTHHTRWMKTDPRFDPIIADNFNYSRYLEVKRNFKLNINDKEKKRGEDGYNPCNKYDYIYQVLVSNMNNLTKKADSDCCIDETTWGFSGFMGEVGGKMIKKKVDSGM
jgi:hypothetical protein